MYREATSDARPGLPIQGKPRWMAYQNPEVVFCFHDGIPAKFRYAEAIAVR